MNGMTHIDSVLALYRTKDTILDIYDAMQQAVATGEHYQTRLDPPPADSRCCHPLKEAT